MIEMIFWSVMMTVFVLYVASGWNDIEEWFWLKGARREIRQMEKDVRRHNARQDQD